MKTFKNFMNEGKDKDKEGDDKAYEAFFNKMLKKYGVKSQDELSDDKKKSFYSEVDKGWKGDNESD